MTLSFSPTLRLNKPKDFKNVRQSGRKLVINSIRVYSHKNQLARPRLGLVIAKREIPKAVARNRFKRVIRESFRLNQHHLMHFDIVIFVQKQALMQEKWHFCNGLEKLWQRLTAYPVK